MLDSIIGFIVKKTNDNIKILNDNNNLVKLRNF